MSCILGTGHLGMRFSSSRRPEQGAGGAGVWPGVLGMEVCRARLNPSLGHNGMPGGEERFWWHSIGVMGLVLCSVRAQQCQYFHKTHLGSRTPLLEWLVLSKQQGASKLLIKKATATPESHRGERGGIAAATAKGHGRRVLWPSVSADFSSCLSPVSHFKYSWSPCKRSIWL